MELYSLIDTGGFNLLRLVCKSQHLWVVNPFLTCVAGSYTRTMMRHL
jgi:hypothetical protein